MSQTVSALTSFRSLFAFFSLPSSFHDSRSVGSLIISTRLFVDTVIVIVVVFVIVVVIVVVVVVAVVVKERAECVRSHR